MHHSLGTDHNHLVWNIGHLFEILIIHDGVVLEPTWRPYGQTRPTLASLVLSYDLYGTIRVFHDWKFVVLNRLENSPELLLGFLHVP
jgi:hypothetical protein